MLPKEDGAPGLVQFGMETLGIWSKQAKAPRHRSKDEFIDSWKTSF